MASRSSERDASTSEADTKVAAIATAARRSRQLHRKQHAVSPSDAANELLADRILAALSLGAPLPSPKLAQGDDFEEAEDEECFGAAAGVDYINQMRIGRLEASAYGRAALKAIRACKESDEDEAHWGGPDSELLEAVVTDSCSPRIHVMRARNPFNPVALLTPLSESPLCAVAAETIQASEPIALYLGELTDELSLESERRTGNTYLYALSRDEMSARGYTAPAQLRVDASRAGAEARFINDCWAPPGLPTRTPNCYAELIFCGQVRVRVRARGSSPRVRVSSPNCYSSARRPSSSTWSSSRASASRKGTRSSLTMGRSSGGSRAR